MLLIGAILLKYSYYVGMAAMLLVSLCIFKKFKLNIFQCLLFTVVAFLSDGLGAFLMGKVYTAVIASLGSEETVNYAIYGAVFLTPVLVIASAAVIKQPWPQIIDMVALSEMFARAFGKLGCLFGGCCWGFEWEQGMYNYVHETNMFPSPLYEFITMLVIIVIGFCFAFRKKYVPGSLYPLTALLYGGTRFFWEFTRYYTYEAERHIVFGMSLWQFCSLITVALSIVWLVGIKKDWLGKAKVYIEVKQFEKAEAERKARAEKRKNKKKKRK
ncbi:MAG: prolipoprotein diacylglyceryl transferase [Clostridia bacterium]|nr:prolipoprotein diacylglyceryl transferase [Clostridia bacterium]